MTPLLSIVTITYNHEPYIAKTIEGVLMQQVNFPIEYIIAEDCSTDDTRKICEEYVAKYPDLINLLPSEHNLGAKENEYRAMKIAKGKYIAFCEGDDYWTDPLKLQKQVDFLESHPDYSVTFHRCRHYNVVNKQWQEDNCAAALNGNDGVDISMDMYFGKWITQPLTMVYRSSIFDLDITHKYKYYRDMHQIYHLLKNGKGYLFAFDGGVRLMQPSGMASLITSIDQCKNGVEISKELYIKNHDIATKKYHADMLQWYLYNIKVMKLNRINYCIQLFKLNHDIKKFIHNILR